MNAKNKHEWTFKTNMNANNKQINECIINKYFKNTSYLCDFQAVSGTLASFWCCSVINKFLWDINMKRDFIGTNQCC